jgi:type I restriction enzyme S subunit
VGKRKDSGVEWIGEIPKDWEKAKMKQIGNYINGYAFKPTDWGDTGKPIIRIQDLTGSNNNPNYFDGIIDNKYNVRVGDILISWAATLDAFIWDREDGWLNQHIFKAIPKLSLVDRKFYFWLMKIAMENMNNDNKHGIVMQHVTTKVFGDFIVPLPPKLNQKKIALFLDEKVSEIDSVIAKTKATIEDYKKYRAAIIDKAVSNKKSPKYKFCYLGSFKNGINYHSTTEQKSVKFLGVGDFKDFMILDKKECFSDMAIDTEIPKEYMLKNGDIIFVRSNGSKELVGRSIMVDNVDYDLTYSGFCIRFRNERLDLAETKYLIYFFRSEYFKELLKLRSFGTNINNLSQDILNTVRVAIPTKKEQIEIIEYLDNECAEIDKLITNKEALIKEMKNYKKSLIYECVTGKKEVI